MYLLALVLLQTLNAAAQPKCKVEYFSTEQGLSHGTISGMIKDREGFMWFGTWDGINRFDGRNFASFKSLQGEMAQKGDYRIAQMMEDQLGFLWIRTRYDEVYRFDKKTRNFLPVSSIIEPTLKGSIDIDSIVSVSNGFVWLQSRVHGIYCIPQNDLRKQAVIKFGTDHEPNSYLSSNIISVFHQDQNLRVWMVTPKGLNCFAPSAPGTYREVNIIPDNIKSKKVTAVTEDELALYFSTDDGHIIVYNKRLLAFSIQKVTGAYINAILRSQRDNRLYAVTAAGEVISLNLLNRTVTTATYPNEDIQSIYEDKRGALWLQPRDAGVIRFDPASAAFSFFSKKINDPRNILGNRFKVFEDVNGTVWVNMKRGGFGYYNTRTATMEYKLDVAGMPAFELPQAVYHSYYDSTGVLWMRIHGGILVRIIFQEENFKQQLLVEQNADLVDNEVRGILCDNKNRLWLGSKSGRLYLRQNDKWVYDFFVNEPAGGLGNIYSIYQDSRNNIWFGTKFNGLFKATPVDSKASQYRLQHFLQDEKNPNSLTSNNIYSILEDKKGRIWIGTFTAGVLLATEQHGSISFVHTGPIFRNYPKDGFQRVRHMSLDRSGNIWIGAMDGLLIMNPDNYAYKAYRKVSDNNTGIGSRDVQFIYADHKHRMWLATGGAGISLATGDPLKALSFRNYTKKDGLPNDYVLSCTGDRQGNLWIATENVLSKFNPEKTTFRNYDSYDGLPRTSFAEAAACHELSNGNLVFGTLEGYISFDPGHVSMKPIPANIVFTKLQINNQEIMQPGEAGFAGSDINYTSKLELKYNENIIGIDYAILDPRAGNRQAFAYRLLGFDTTWHTDRELKGVSYSNLPPGDYVLEVQSLYTDLYSNKPGKRLEITILPPPWKTGWAYFAYALVLLLILAVIRNYAVKMVRLRNKVVVEQKLAALKLNFFTGVSHELRTPLTLIVNPLEAIARKENLSAEGVEYVEVARKNADRMIRFINQLLDLRKVQSEKATLKLSRVDIINFVGKVSDYFAEAIKSKRITLTIAADQPEIFASVDPEKFDVIIYNLLSNAIKFTPEGKSIKIGITENAVDKSFSIAVHDTGTGVKNDQLEKIFGLFEEGSHTTSSTTKGIGIGLALTKEFVTLHGGTIVASNNENGGLTITVKMKQRVATDFTDQVLLVNSPAAANANVLTAEPIPDMQPVDGHLLQHPEAPLLLLVEDNTDLCQFLGKQLSEFYRVEIANNGEEGWKKVRTLLPDLILSDIMMPVMDGIQLLDKVKHDVNTSHIPVVLLSAKYSIESQIEGLKYGADCYITKPFNNEFLIASITNILRQRKQLVEQLMQKKQPIALSVDPVVITSKDEVFLKNAILAVEDKMGDPLFKVETIADTMAMGQKTFYRKFKSLAGVTPAEFVRDIRLQRAKQLLDVPGNNVSEVAYQVGFTSPKYFSTCFKEKYHVPPSDYLKTKVVPADTQEGVKAKW